MYGNNFVVKAYQGNKLFYKTYSQLHHAKIFAAKCVSKNFYSKAEIYLVNAVYEVGDCLVFTYHADNYKGNKRGNKNV